MRTRIKVCGLTRIEDVQSAVAAGVDALGFVFVGQSRRNLTLAQARELFAAVPPFVQTVALFMNAEAAMVHQVCDQLSPGLLQFHGNESAAYCEQFGCPYIKAIPAREGEATVNAIIAEHKQAAGFLLDSHGGDKLGGTGETFDWSMWPSKVDRPLILAGGLNPENVRQAIEMLHPYAVDVSSGVECAPGIKDPLRISRFINEVNHAKG